MLPGQRLRSLASIKRGRQATGQGTGARAPVQLLLPLASVRRRGTRGSKVSTFRPEELAPQMLRAAGVGETNSRAQGSFREAAPSPSLGFLPWRKAGLGCGLSLFFMRSQKSRLLCAVSQFQHTDPTPLLGRISGPRLVSSLNPSTGSDSASNLASCPLLPGARGLPLGAHSLYVSQRHPHPLLEAPSFFASRTSLFPPATPP